MDGLDLQAEARRAISPYEALRELGLSLPAARPPVANFAPAVIEGGLVFLSGQGPVGPEGIVYQGKVGSDLSLEDGYAAAKLTTLNLLATLHQAIGDLARVRKIVKVLGMVNAPPDFLAHPIVINGCSDLLVSVFGADIGAHARSAVGVASLPGQIAVEIEMIVAV